MSTPATRRWLAKYWAEFRQVRERWGALTEAEVTERRRDLMRKALGYDKSAGDLDRLERDAVLAAFRAEASPNDFAAQMDVQESPERMRQAMVARCKVAMETISPDGSQYGTDRQREGYLATIAKNLGDHWQWPPKNIDTLRKVMGVVERRAWVVRNKAKPIAKKSEDVPF